MLLKLNKNIDWESLTIELGNNSLNKDENFISRNGIQIYSFGYPYDAKIIEWMEPETIYKKFLEKNVEIYKDLEGIFNILILDKKNGKLIIITDPYYCYSLYYFLSNSTILISDKIREIQRITDSKINSQSVIEFLNCGFILGDKTLFKDIYKFDGSRIYTLTKDKFDFTIKTYFSLGDDNPNYCSKNDFYKVFTSHMEDGLKLSENISLPLTAGIDSRTILSSCLNKKNKLHCFTHGQENSNDVKIAKKICDDLNINYKYYNVFTPESELANKIPKIPENLNKVFEGGLNSLLFSHLFYSFRKERKYSDTLFHGNGGEFIKLFYFPTNYKHLNSLEELSESILSKIQVNEVDYDIFSSSKKQIRNILKEEIWTQLEEANIQSFENLSEYFYLRNRIGNFASLVVKFIGKYFNVFLPFFSKGIFNTFPALKKDDKLNRNLHKFIIKKNSSYLSKIIVNKKYCIKNDIDIKLRSLIEKSVLLSKKLITKIINKNLFKYSASHNYSDLLRKQYHNFVLNNKFNENLKDILEKKQVDKLVTSYLKGKTSYYKIYFITNLISLNVYLNKV